MPNRTLALALVLAATPAAAQAAQPTIVVVMADDMPALDGRLERALPSIAHRFVEHGIRFADFHSETPLCCPARAGFLTGQHTHNHGVTRNSAALLDPSMTLATQLHGAGYHTLIVGKYLNQYDAIADRGLPPGWDEGSIMPDPSYFDYWLYRNGEYPAGAWHGEAPGDYSTAVLQRAAVSLLRDAPRNRPVFLWFAPFGPHAPTTPAPEDADAPCSIPAWSPPSYDEADVSDKPAYVRGSPRLGSAGASLRNRCRALLSIDRAFAAIHDELAAEGRLASTLFVLAGDNGMNVGEHRLQDKQAPYATDVPFWVYRGGTPGAAPATVAERVQNIDLAPTLCELAGCRMGPYPNGQKRPDGISFASLLTNPAGHLDRDAVLDEAPEIKTAGLKHAPPPWWSVTTTARSPLGPWQYIEYATGEVELYDLADDPWELENVAGNPLRAGVESALAARLAALRVERGAG